MEVCPLVESFTGVFVLPAIEWGERWQAVVDTRAANAPDANLRTGAGEIYPLDPRSLAVLRLVTQDR